MSDFRAILAEVRRLGIETPSDAAVARCIGDVCSELLAGARQSENWFDEIVARTVAHFRKQHPH